MEQSRVQRIQALAITAVRRLRTNRNLIRIARYLFDSDWDSNLAELQMGKGSVLREFELITAFW